MEPEEVVATDEEEAVGVEEVVATDEEEAEATVNLLLRAKAKVNLLLHLSKPTRCLCSKPNGRIRTPPFEGLPSVGWPLQITVRHLRR